MAYCSCIRSTGYVIPALVVGYASKYVSYTRRCRAAAAAASAVAGYGNTAALLAPHDWSIRSYMIPAVHNIIPVDETRKTYAHPFDQRALSRFLRHRQCTHLPLVNEAGSTGYRLLTAVSEYECCRAVTCGSNVGEIVE